MKKYLVAILCLATMAVYQTSMAQTNAEQEVLKNLIGMWETENDGTYYLEFKNDGKRTHTITGSRVATYDWDLKNVTISNATGDILSWGEKYVTAGTIDYTNNRNTTDKYDFRNLNKYTCEFKMWGVWHKAHKCKKQIVNGQTVYAPVDKPATTRPTVTVTNPVTQPDNTTITSPVINQTTEPVNSLTQLEAINLLTGRWATEPTSSSVPYSTLTFENRTNPSKRLLNTTGFATKSYDNWGIHTNTRNFATGVIQATNSSPFLNDNYNYRNLTKSTCEFLINGVWVKATKQRSASPVNYQDTPNIHVDNNAGNSRQVYNATNQNNNQNPVPRVNPTDNKVNNNDNSSKKKNDKKDKESNLLIGLLKALTGSDD